MLKNEKGEVLAVSYINRVMDVTMEGTYGYQSKRFREAGGVMLTAVSTVEEFAVERLDEVDLPHFGRQMCFIGTDYYGREMQLPLSRIKGMRLRDTDEQGKLKGLNWCLRTFDELPKDGVVLTEEQKATLDEHFGTMRQKRDELVAAGVTEYEPRRATEDEL
jgi:hypothetical protein